VDQLSALLVARLLLSLLVAHNALIGTVGRLGLRLWHALLAAMLSALVLHTFQIVLFGHRNRTLSCRLGCFEVAAGFLTAVNAIPGRRVPISSQSSPREKPALGREPKSAS
jgi:hypothetical protein